MFAKAQGWEPDKDVKIVALGGLDAQMAALARKEIAAYVWGDGGAVMQLAGKSRVLMRLDAGKLDLKNPRVHRADRDFAVSWAKMYGKGRVFYSTLGHPVENWDRADMQKMFTEGIKWALGLVDADVTPRPAR